MTETFFNILLFSNLAFIYAASVSRRTVDLTYVFDNDTLHHPAVKKFEIKVVMNETDDDGYWLQLEDYSSATHVGTHMDAPCHFSPGSWCVDQIPVDRFIAPAAVVDIEAKVEDDRDYEVTIDDLKEWEEETGHELDGVILMIKSGWGKRWGDRELFTGTAGNDSRQLHYPGMAPATAEWLRDERNVYGVGTETLSIDNGPSIEYKTHTTLLGANIYFIENVANMDQLPLYGAKLYVMPMKIGQGSGAPTRVIATVPDVIYPTKSKKGKALKEVIIFS